ncbi:YggT family protein [Enterobacterales bacterium endosymbiont of Anomoneura mori]|uniref:YggT family protein n=1 Tax=Enterobacterales bacterium endosymbiont of Anomoneura mori TaxID=3132096 RepID=UPI00399CB1FD
MLTFNFLIKNIIDFLTISILLRAWIEWTLKKFKHPFANFIIKITQFPINLFKKFIPIFNSIYKISFLISFGLMIIKFLILSYIQNTSPVISLPTILILSLVSLIKILNYLIFWIFSMFILMNFFNQKESLFKQFISQLSNKIINLFKILLPKIKSNNYYSLFIILILYLINYLGIDLFGNVWFML